MAESTGSNSQQSGLEPNIASLLCYLLMLFTCGLPVPGLVFIVIEKSNALVRFHAWQSIMLGAAAWVGSVLISTIGGLAGKVFGLFGYLFGLANLAVIAGGCTLWVICMIKAYQHEAWRIPVLGDFAARQAGERSAPPPPSA